MVICEVNQAVSICINRVGYFRLPVCLNEIHREEVPIFVTDVGHRAVTKVPYLVSEVDACSRMKSELFV